MTLPEQGFRFVLRKDEGRLVTGWVHPAEVRSGDIDCTDMDDDTFERAYHAWAEKAGEKA